jgi:zinc resistance-associated protein
MGYGRHMGYGPGPEMGYGPGTGRGYGRHMGSGPGTGRSYGRHMGYGPGMDRGRGMGSGPVGKGFRGRGFAPELSAEEWKKLDEQRNTFFKATDDLRQKSYSKRLELQSEFAKKNPDAGKAAGLQKELSNLRAQIDQKRIGHLIEMRKINPNAGKGFARRGGRGSMRSGPAFGGPCWR